MTRGVLRRRSVLVCVPRPKEEDPSDPGGGASRGEPGGPGQYLLESQEGADLCSRQVVRHNVEHPTYAHRTTDNTSRPLPCTRPDRAIGDFDLRKDPGREYERCD